MILQQYLVGCRGCTETLAIEYSGSHGRLTDTVLRVRRFACPRCGRDNPVFVPRSAGPFTVKLVPGGGAPPPMPRAPVLRVDAASLRPSDTQPGGRPSVGSPHFATPVAAAHQHLLRPRLLGRCWRSLRWLLARQP